MDALKKQVGGEHYKKLTIQPVELIRQANLDFFLGNVVKYLVRDKGQRREDLEKAYHYLEMCRKRRLSNAITALYLESYKSNSFFKQFKNGNKYAQVVGYAVVGNIPKAKELLRKFINKGEYSEV